MGKLDGKVAFITGVARGQGRAEALALAAEGADIIGIDICGPVATNVAEASTHADLENTALAVKELGRTMVAAEADVRDYAGLKAALDEGVRQLGRLDIVVANAGMWNYGLTETITEEMWDVVQDVNLKGVWHTAKAAIPILKAQGSGGAMVFTTSSMATIGAPNMSPYCAAKHGVSGLVKTIAMELAPHNVRVNSVAPTTVNTKLIHNQPTYALFAPDLAADELTLDNVEPRFATIPLLDVAWVEPEDIAGAVVYLASDDARYVTGLDLRVDAGQILN
ncbi:mycofactocin-coupled SDR family oxidoreductase [Gordonia sp. TBRC 11910]|uniref:Mycofactocin-coupled SDR family oxidoreductase n=1 Tax=Gordonia asplenii TaxID=2725283 RepID=A0A848KW69_9ACTN|nr:mycofactocin-coupled SDR family oxidoreductase [Gordonia asplenii]NMO00703.1 mycofactocin-coupled SDR family oxidoreductase [Gordonia asplenii]